MVKRIIGIILVTGGIAAGAAVPVITAAAPAAPVAASPYVYFHS